MDTQSFAFTREGTFFKLSGALDGDGARRLELAMDTENIFTLDFDEVCSINFAALRCLLRCRQKGMRFLVINVGEAVAEKFEDTGVSSFINICRKPKALDMSQYVRFGESFLSKAFNSSDGDSMIKVYGPRVPKAMVAQEKAIARAVLVFGIPTPLVGSLYYDGENSALDFERIEGKRSFSRIIADEPERMEEISVRFARMCKNLHSTPCDTNIFNSRKLYYRAAVDRCPELTPEEKSKVQIFLDSVPDATTCLHGDMQMSNVITAGGEDMWIDLADFGFGNPLLDLGMWYFLCKLNTEEFSQHLFHLGLKDMSRIWDFFAREYFGADTPEKLAEVDKRMEPFAALHMLYLGSTYGFVAHLLEYVREKLL